LRCRHSDSCGRMSDHSFGKDCSVRSTLLLGAFGAEDFVSAARAAKYPNGKTAIESENAANCVLVINIVSPFYFMISIGNGSAKMAHAFHADTIMALFSLVSGEPSNSP
jgi:hypothetical protein